MRGFAAGLVIFGVTWLLVTIYNLWQMGPNQWDERKGSYAVALIIIGVALLLLSVALSDPSATIPTTTTEGTTTP